MPLDLFYTMVQKSRKWPKTQIKGGSCLKQHPFIQHDQLPDHGRLQRRSCLQPSCSILQRSSEGQQRLLRRNALPQPAQDWQENNRWLATEAQRHEVQPTTKPKCQDLDWQAGSQAHQHQDWNSRRIREGFPPGLKLEKILNRHTRAACGRVKK